MADPVRTEVVDGVLVVTLDRPTANAIDVATSLALYDAFARLESDADLRVGVVTGGGERFFSAGWDLKAAADHDAPGPACQVLKHQNAQRTDTDTAPEDESEQP